MRQSETTCSCSCIRHLCCLILTQDQCDQRASVCLILTRDQCDQRSNAHTRQAKLYRLQLISENSPVFTIEALKLAISHSYRIFVLLDSDQGPVLDSMTWGRAA